MPTSRLGIVRSPLGSRPHPAGRAYEVNAVATARGRQYREGYQLLEHRDLETRYLYRAARSEVRGVDVKVAPGLSVGYVMGAGDQVPAGISQLGARVRLLVGRIPPASSGDEGSSRHRALRGESWLIWSPPSSSRSSWRT